MRYAKNRPRRQQQQQQSMDEPREAAGERRNKKKITHTTHPTTSIVICVTVYAEEIIINVYKAGDIGVCMGLHSMPNNKISLSLYLSLLYSHMIFNVIMCYGGMYEYYVYVFGTIAMSTIHSLNGRDTVRRQKRWGTWGGCWWRPKWGLRRKNEKRSQQKKAVLRNAVGRSVERSTHTVIHLACSAPLWLCANCGE